MLKKVTYVFALLLALCVPVFTQDVRVPSQEQTPRWEEHLPKNAVAGSCIGDVQRWGNISVAEADKLPFQELHNRYLRMFFCRAAAGAEINGMPKTDSLGRKVEVPMEYLEFMNKCSFAMDQYSEFMNSRSLAFIARHNLGKQFADEDAAGKRPTELVK